jgi:hypothetical protein
VALRQVPALRSETWNHGLFVMPLANDASMLSPQICALRRRISGGGNRSQNPGGADARESTPHLACGGEIA